MKQKYKRDLPFGLLLLCAFYVINAFLFFVTASLFYRYLDIIAFGKALSDIPAFFTRCLLIILPMYLAHGLYLLRKDAYFASIGYHSFFIINGALTVFRLLNKAAASPLFEIALKPEYKIERIRDLFGAPFHIYLVQITGSAIGLFIIAYLLTKRKLFKCLLYPI